MNMMRAFATGHTIVGNSPPRVLLGHCRKKTVGSEYMMVNNHPITFPETDVVGIHNGGVTNHSAIIKKLGGNRIGEVDSEALIRLFEHEIIEKQKATNTSILDIEDLQRVAVRAEGPRAALMFCAKEPTKLYAICEGRPMVIYYEKNLGLVFFVSESKFMDLAIAHYYETKITLDPTLPNLELVCEEVPDRTAIVLDLTVPIRDNATLKTAFKAMDYPATKDKEWSDIKTTTTTYAPATATRQSLRPNAPEREEARKELATIIVELEAKNEDTAKVLDVQASIKEEENTSPDFVLEEPKEKEAYPGDNTKIHFAGEDENDKNMGEGYNEYKTEKLNENEDTVTNIPVDMEETGLMTQDPSMKNEDRVTKINLLAMESLCKKVASNDFSLIGPSSDKELADILGTSVEKIRNEEPNVLIAILYQLLYKEVFVEGYMAASKDGISAGLTNLRKKNVAFSSIVRSAVIALADMMHNEPPNSLTKEDVVLAIDTVIDSLSLYTKPANPEITSMSLKILESIKNGADKIASKVTTVNNVKVADIVEQSIKTKVEGH